MEIQKEKSTKKKKLTITAVAILGLLVVVFCLFILPAMQSKPTTNSSANSTKKSEDNKKASENLKNSPDPSKSDGTVGNDQPATPATQADGRKKVDVLLSAANQNGATVQIRFDILTITNTGTCTLTLTKDQSTVTKSASVQALPDSSTCKGFDIPTSELNPGTWQIKLHFENSETVADTTGSMVVR